MYASKDYFFVFLTISEARIRHLVRFFSLDMTTTENSAFTKCSIRTVNALSRQIH